MEDSDDNFETIKAIFDTNQLIELFRARDIEVVQDAFEKINRGKKR